MRLALVGALQQLPPRQRAVLILRDVLQRRTTEVADLLGMTPAAVNSALQRPQAQVPVSQDELTEPVQPQLRALLARYVTAFETADVEQLVAVSTEDARWEMPPIATWFEGRDTVVAFLARMMRVIGPATVVATAANGQPAFAVYARGRDGSLQPHAMHVLALTTAGVARVVAFHGAGLFPLFGLGSTDAADRMVRRIHRHARDHRDDQQFQRSGRYRLFGIAAEATAREALTVVDASQSCGWLDVPYAEFDVVVCPAFKWLHGPRGAAFLAVAPHRLAGIRPSSAGWWASEGARHAFGGPLQLAGTARRLDISPVWNSWGAAAAALATVESIGIETDRRPRHRARRPAPGRARSARRCDPDRRGAGQRDRGGPHGGRARRLRNAPWCPPGLRAVQRHRRCRSRPGGAARARSALNSRPSVLS